VNSERWDAVLFLWTHGPARPHAAAKFFAKGDYAAHEFQSLACEPFRAEWHGGTVWSPKRQGVDFQTLDGAEEPATGRGERLRQMREIAESFRADVRDIDDVERHALQLHEKPLYRYTDEESQTLDGVLWAFLHGASPELLLIVEVHGVDDAHARWQYALAPMTSHPAEVDRAGKRVWTIGRREVPTRDPTSGYLVRERVPRT
jgi:hypothetical protein